ncbi:sirohydrochlorin cobaltochelatase [Clostridium tetanomorphum]|uniref:Sirohydrochlorin cobaltochelatase n=2 Tax=Clostridium tetanomorphum TaxID=1553 RepID=A0A923EAM7_CLOTT|nr:sirohydrochlorin cobaltochelatase [Clostridium tetanomorphum]MBC2397756.1 sirohydrochlorin cobaltochelatase [Clostridium tetanomorphum]
MSKKAILVVSFGTSYHETRKATIEAIENKIKEDFKDYEVRRAFTSGMIINKLKKRDGIFIDNTEEALERLANDGFEDVYVQCLHIMPGEEYDDIKIAVHKYEYKKIFKKLVLGRPLLYRTDDYFKAVEALKNQIPERIEDHAVVFMGHGSTHHANSSYALFQYVINESGLNNVLIANVEGFPELDVIIPKLKEKNIKEITLMPFMLVAGDHATNDMAGDEEDSWKSILENEGFKVNIYLHGIGENENIQKIFIQHLQDCIDGNPLIEE